MHTKKCWGRRRDVVRKVNYVDDEWSEQLTSSREVMTINKEISTSNKYSDQIPTHDIILKTRSSTRLIPFEEHSIPFHRYLSTRIASYAESDVQCEPSDFQSPMKDYRARNWSWFEQTFSRCLEFWRSWPTRKWPDEKRAKTIIAYVRLAGSRSTCTRPFEPSWDVLIQSLIVIISVIYKNQ